MTHPGGERQRWLLAAFIVVTVVFALGLTAGALLVPRQAQIDVSGSTPSTEADSSAIPLGSSEKTVARIHVEGKAGNPALITYDAAVGAADAPSSQAAMVSFRVECRSPDGKDLPMQTTGTTTTNVFIARGGTLRGQALSPALPDGQTTCSLIGGAPFATAPVSGMGDASLPVTVELRQVTAGDPSFQQMDGELEDATALTRRTSEAVLDTRFDTDSRHLDVFATVRLTSCTVVDGSRDGDGPLACKPGMVGPDASTVRIRVLARTYDDAGKQIGGATLWDEDAAVAPSTHHLPWTIRLENIDRRMTGKSATTRITVIVGSVAGTPVTVHANGTDGVVSHHS
ncbi:hypothetical protein GCM10011512_16060 [Tersicoccus solisilvae]|uniref:Uncharacterized protein n=1 Tax=Tersicoccus solisilvae TaxID=1882339 RepID=A0ABQ1P640_9MICC|nr:hypothetical protein [Tersicoccus solisilvae]GGC89898.1 hypothetical protein GCM10011512_16060 [Tersicoccus solisilvae]